MDKFTKVLLDYFFSFFNFFKMLISDVAKMNVNDKLVELVSMHKYNNVKELD